MSPAPPAPRARRGSVLRVFADTGPLVSYCLRRDAHHDWSVEIAAALRPPLYTCEAVLAEVFWRIGSEGGRPELIWEWIDRRVLVVDFHAADHWADLSRLMRKYADQPMDFADACVVKMTELVTECRVWTTDTRDFKVYRRKERLQIPLIVPLPGT